MQNIKSISAIAYAVNRIAIHHVIHVQTIKLENSKAKTLMRVELYANTCNNLQVLVFGAHHSQFQTTVHLLLTQLDRLVKCTATLHRNSHT